MSTDPEDPFQKIEDLFRAGKPKESQKRQRRPSKRTLISRLLLDIERLLAEGYSFVGIAGYFVDLGLHMPVSTLKNYVTRARRDLARTSQKARHPATSRGASNAPQQMSRRVTAPGTKRDSARVQTPHTAEGAPIVLAGGEHQRPLQSGVATHAEMKSSTTTRAFAEDEVATTDGSAKDDGSHRATVARPRPAAASTSPTQVPSTTLKPQTFSTGTGWVPRNR